MISFFILEAALRSLLLALAVAIGLRIFTVRNVLAQKAAWGLVLASALLMPLMLPIGARMAAPLVIPARMFRVFGAFSPGQYGESSPPAITMGSPDAPRSTNLPDTGQIRTTIIAPTPRTKSGGSQFTANEEGIGPADRYPAPVISNARMGASTQTELSGKNLRASLLQLTGLLYVAVASVLTVRLLYGLFVAIHLWQSADRSGLNPLPWPTVFLCV